MGINFVKQYAQMGLKAEIPFYAPAFTVDHTILPAQGEAALGIVNSSFWSPDLPNPVNRKFVADFQQIYDAALVEAAQGYDAALFINHAVHVAGGDLRNKDKLRTALRQASFASVRGSSSSTTTTFLSRIFIFAKGRQNIRNGVITQELQDIASRTMLMLIMNSAQSCARAQPTPRHHGHDFPSRAGPEWSATKCHAVFTGGWVDAVFAS